MELETLREYALLKAGVSEGFPFGEGTLVLKVKEKIFMLIALDESPLRMNLKCDPERALELREAYASVLPGYHMNKKHWNTVVLDGRVPKKIIFEMIDGSYNLVQGKK
jgi:predicted DNA-binding protein (MmcQ/YjbR family)